MLSDPDQADVAKTLHIHWNIPKDSINGTVTLNLEDSAETFHRIQHVFSDVGHYTVGKIACFSSGVGSVQVKISQRSMQGSENGRGS